MAASGFGRQEDVTAENVIVQLEMEEAVSSKQEDIVLKRLSPLLYSMRLFGLYFTRKQRVSPAAAPEQRNERKRRCPDWNFARIYSTIMLAITWLNAIRYAIIFNGNETLGAALFTKLAIVPSALMIILLHSSYYYASHTGSLDRVLRYASSHAVGNNLSKYDRLTKVMTVLPWILVSCNMFQYVYDLFTDSQSNDFLFFSSYFSEAQLFVVKAVFIFLHLLTVNVWFFPLAIKLNAVLIFLIFSSREADIPLAMNFMVMMLLYDQYDNLNAEFSRCVGDGGEFSGNFEQFRRRHQAISRSVHEADCFIKISNVACFCCQIVTIIFVFYITVFFREDTVLVGVMSTLSYVAWLGYCVSGLSLTAGQAVILNHRASTLIL